MTPRFDIRVHSVQLTPDRRSLILATDPLPAAVHYSLQLPGMGRPPLARGASKGGDLPQVPEIDLDFDLSGVQTVTKTDEGKTTWSGWLPSLDLDVSRALTSESAHHEELWVSDKEETLVLKTQLILDHLMQPAVQPGA